jgi:putative phosphoesterase
MLVGLVSDTHGLVRPGIFDALQGVSLILHAGDVGGQGVLDELAAIAPVQAVYGNGDVIGEPNLHSHLSLELEGLSVRVTHGHELGTPSPPKLLALYSADVIVFGHTHKPLVERSGSRLVINPGAAGPRRFNLKPSVARLRVERGETDVEILWL